MGSTLRWWVGLVLVAVIAVLTAASASAHEEDLLGNGQYQVIVGFLVEPAFVGEKNGLQLYVAKLASLATPEPGDATPVAADEVFDRPIEGLESTLRAEVVHGDERLALTLEPVYGSPGEYAAYFFPMAEGDYGFRIFGTIDGIVIDETFTSSPEGFSSVRPRIEFPAETAGSSRGAVGLPVMSGALALAGIAVRGMAHRRRRQTI